MSCGFTPRPSLPDALKWNLQVTPVAIIKTVLLWRCVQSVLSPASDCFKVAEGKRESERDAVRQEEMEEMGKLEQGKREDKIIKRIFKDNFYGRFSFTWELEEQTAHLF